MDRKELLRDPQDSLRTAMDGNRVSLHTALPGLIESIDLSTQTVSVQPTIQFEKINVAKDGTITYTPVTLPLLIKVPLFFPRGGDYAITFPVKVGDECLVIFAERCIDSWWESGKVGPQIEFRMHDLSDGFAIVGFSSVPHVVPNIDADKMQIRKLDSSTVIELSDEGVAINTDQDVTVDASNIALTATNNLDLNADIINLTCNTLNIDAGVINYL